MTDLGLQPDFALEVAPAGGREWRWTVLHNGAAQATGGAADEAGARRHGLVFAATLSALKRAAGRRP